MEVTLTIEKKHIYIILGVFIIFTAMIFVFAATPNPGHPAEDISGTFSNEDFTFPGSMTISGTGGDVPHACYKKTKSSGSASELFVYCAAGEITIGGGGSCSSSIIRASRPTSALLTSWNVVCTAAGSMSAYAICCKV